MASRRSRLTRAARPRAFIPGALALAAALLAAASLAAAQTADAPLEVDLELVLLADATGSIDDAEIRFQREGYAQALRDPLLVRALTGGVTGRAAVAYVEWGAADSQQMVAGWTVIDDVAAAEAFAETLMTAPRQAFGRNAIGSALTFARREIETNAYDGGRKIIDFAGDSANSWDPIPITAARDAAVAADITVNGLAMLCRASGCSGRPVAYDLEEAFRRDIIGGPGAFVITADGSATFADAVRRKLFLEVSGTEPPDGPRAGRLAVIAPPAPGSE